MSKTQTQVCFAGAVVTHIEFQNALKKRAQDKPQAAPPPLDDNAVRARIKYLEADNARMQADREKRAKESAEQLMRQMLGNKN